MGKIYINAEPDRMYYRNLSMEKAKMDCIFAELARNRGLCILNQKETAEWALPEIRLLYPEAVVAEYKGIQYIAATGEAKARLKGYLCGKLKELEKRASELRSALTAIQ